MGQNAPKAKRKVGKSNAMAHNKAVKSFVKSDEAKSDVSSFAAKNKSGGTKPFSKIGMPSSPSVPKKGKK